MADRSTYRTQYQNQVAELGEEDQVIADQEAQAASIRRVRLLCCANAQDAAEALELMEYLGIAPGQDPLPARVYFQPSNLPSPKHSPGGIPRS